MSIDGISSANIHFSSSYTRYLSSPAFLQEDARQLDQSLSFTKLDKPTQTLLSKLLNLFKNQSSLSFKQTFSSFNLFLEIDKQIGGEGGGKGVLDPRLKSFSLKSQLSQAKFMSELGLSPDQLDGQDREFLKELFCILENGIEDLKELSDVIAILASLGHISDKLLEIIQNAIQDFIDQNASQAEDFESLAYFLSSVSALMSSKISILLPSDYQISKIGALSSEALSIADLEYRTLSTLSPRLNLSPVEAEDDRSFSQEESAPSATAQADRERQHAEEELKKQTKQSEEHTLQKRKEEEEKEKRLSEAKRLGRIYHRPESHIASDKPDHAPIQESARALPIQKSAQASGDHARNDDHSREQFIYDLKLKSFQKLNNEERQKIADLSRFLMKSISKITEDNSPKVMAGIMALIYPQLEKRLDAAASNALDIFERNERKHHLDSNQRVTPIENTDLF